MCETEKRKKIEMKKKKKHGRITEINIKFASSRNGRRRREKITVKKRSEREVSSPCLVSTRLKRQRC